MNTLDIIIICTLMFFIIRGIFRGFIREITSLAGVLIAIWTANKFQPQLTLILKNYLSSFPFLPLVSFAIIFASVIILSIIAAILLKKIVHKILLGWIDRIFGGGIAALKALILTYLVIILLTFFLPSKAPLIARSKLAPLIVSSYQALVELISPDLYQKWKKKFILEEKKISQKSTPGTGTFKNEYRSG